MALEPYYEWRTGIRSFGPGEADTFSIATDYHSLWRMLGRVGVEAGNDVFVDYGCGRGRALALAGQYPFKRVIGVEYSAKLATSARENIDRIRSRLVCKDVLIVQADAADFEFPQDGTVVYMFNPFAADVLDRVLARIHESMKRNPRRITIIYFRPDCEASLERCAWLAKKEDLQCVTARCCIYESVLQ